MSTLDQNTISDALTSEFKLLGVTPSKEIVKQCVEMCEKYGLDAEAFMVEWISFSVTYLNNKIIPESSTLLIFESRQLKLTAKQERVEEEYLFTSDSAPGGNYDEVDEDDLNLMNSYYKGSPKAKRAKKKNISTVASSTSLNETLKDEEIPTSKYSERTDNGRTILTFGPERLISSTDISTGNTNAPHVKLCGDCADLGPDTRYMHNYPVKHRQAATYINETIAKSIIQKEMLEEPELFIPFSMDNITTYGRICNSEKGKLTENNILLESSYVMAEGHKAQLIPKDLSSFSLFPGQIVVIRSKSNSLTNSFMPEKLYCNSTLPLPEKLPDLSIIQGPMDILIACGPYTLHNDLAYLPLQDLLNYVVKRAPHVVVFIGPFLDQENEMVKNNSLSESFVMFFDKLIDKIMNGLKSLKNTQVVIVPSQRDVCQQYVYPTPPYTLRRCYNNLHLAPDPAVLDINGVTVGLTSTDVLYHLGKHELYQCKTQTDKTPKVDRMSRLASHLLAQRSFYPLYPPDKEVNMDLDLLVKHAMLSFTPHIMLLPSNFKCFVKNIDGCVVINPERVTKYSVGGTFCEIRIFPEQDMPSVANNMVCRIIKI